LYKVKIWKRGCEEVKRVTLGLFAALLSLSASSAAIAQTCLWQTKNVGYGS
jgi:hypothetical protein